MFAVHGPSSAKKKKSSPESERKERTVGSFEHTPQHLYEHVDDPCFGFVESCWSCSGGGDCDYDSS
jgi:hypothetical protein